MKFIKWLIKMFIFIPLYAGIIISCSIVFLPIMIGLIPFCICFVVAGLGFGVSISKWIGLEKKQIGNKKDRNHTFNGDWL